MIAKTTTVINQTGIHARPASDFVYLAKGFQSKITIENLDRPDSEPVNAKSAILVLTRGMGKGTTVRVAADGPDEAAAVDALIEMIGSGFNE